MIVTPWTLFSGTKTATHKHARWCLGLGCSSARRLQHLPPAATMLVYQCAAPHLSLPHPHSITTHQYSSRRHLHKHTTQHPVTCRLTVILHIHWPCPRRPHPPEARPTKCSRRHTFPLSTSVSLLLPMKAHAHGHTRTQHHWNMNMPLVKYIFLLPYKTSHSRKLHYTSLKNLAVSLYH